MTLKASNRPNCGRAAVRLLLALLLALTPLLAAAGGVQLTAPGGDAGDAPVALTQMPCHSADTQVLQAADPEQQDACPHCTTYAPASQCHCCGHAAPAGLTALTFAPRSAEPSGLPTRHLPSDALPESPSDRRYRPPIFHS